MTESPPVPADRKLGALETLRGFGSVIVLLHHTGLALIPFAYLGTVAQPHFAWERWFHSTPLGLLVAGRFAVDVFFVLSGFVLALSFLGPNGKDDRELAAATVKRVFRLAPMVAVGVLLSGLLNRLGWMQSAAGAEVSGSAIWLARQGGWDASWITLGKVIGFNLFSQGQRFNSALWTIELELIGSYLVYLLLFAVRRSSWRWGVYAWLAVWLRNELLLAFLAGLALADAYAQFPAFRQWSRRAWVAGPALALAVFLGSYPEGAKVFGQAPGGWYRALPYLELGKDGWLFAGAVLLIATCVGSPAVLRALDSRPGRFLGRISFGLYATHIPVLCSLGCWVLLRLHRAGSPYAVAAGAAAAATVLGSLILAVVVTRWVDQPSVRFASWVGKRFAASLAGARDGGAGARVQSRPQTAESPETNG